MADEVPKNGPYEPATDEQIEFWQVQVEYGAKPVVGPVERGAFGGILARLAKAEADRDAARRDHCEALREVAQMAYDERGGSEPRAVREIAVDMYGEDVAARLWPAPQEKA